MASHTAGSEASRIGHGQGWELLWVGRPAGPGMGREWALLQEGRPAEPGMDGVGSAVGRK